MKNSKCLTSIILILLVLHGSILSAQSLYLDIEPPDAEVKADNSTQYQYYEGGNKYRRETANGWGFGQIVSEGRTPESPNSLQAVWPADSRSGATNRMEWKFKSWAPNTEYWTGFSVKFDENYPTPLLGQQFTMFSQMKNSGNGAQLKFYIQNKPSINDPLEFWFQIQYGLSSSNREIVNIYPGKILNKGEWLDVVSNYKINPNQSDSFVKVWINGELVIDYNGKIGFEANQGSGSHKIGLYGGSQNALRKMNIDEIRYGSNYAEVDPAQSDNANPSENRKEAELAGTQTGFSPFQTGTDNSASSGQFIHAPNKDSRNSVPSSGKATYNYTLENSGDAELTVRLLATNTSSNSFWYRIDEEPWLPWSVQDPSSDWQELSRTISGLTSGDHTISVAYREGNTKLDWFELSESGPITQPPTEEIEAETANSQNNFSPFQVGLDTDASGGEYIYAPSNNSRNNAPINGQASYNFSVDSSGDQIFTVRLLANSTSENSFWYKIDSGAWSPWSISNISSNWQEVDRTIAGLSVGNHTLTIAYREGDTKLDWFKIAPQVSGTALRASVTQVSDIDEIYGNNDTNIKTPTIYPNPVNNILNVGLSLIENSGYSATLLDFSGRMVFGEQYSGRIGTNTISIDVSTLQKGTYILIIETGLETTRRKIIIQ